MIPLFQGVLEALKGLGGGMAKGIGSGQGLPFLQNIGQKSATPNVAMKNPFTGKIAQITAPPSKWGAVGEMIGKSLGGSSAERPPEAPLPLTSNTVQRGKGITMPEKKTQIQLLIEKLARSQG